MATNLTWRRSVVPVAVSFALHGAMARADTLWVPDDHPTIQSAVDAANAGDEVRVAPGLYAESIDLRGKQILLRAAAGPNLTVIDGAGLGSSAISATSGESTATVVEGFRIRNGEGTAGSVCGLSGTFGGAVRVIDSGLTLRACVFENNTAVTIGGAVFAANSTLDLTSCSFINNSAVSGGGLLTCETEVTAYNCNFLDNVALFGGGAYFAASDDEAIVLVNNLFVRNSASHGGGVWASIESESGLTITASNFDQNSADHGAGMRLHGAPGGDVLIVDTDFSNGAAAFGGAINASMDDVDGSIEIRSCDIWNNVAGFGGGIVAITNDAGNIDIFNCHLWSNVADGSTGAADWQTSCHLDGPVNGQYFGGAVDLRAVGGGQIRMVNSTLTSNTGTLAGGAHLSTCEDGVVEMVNCTVADNFPSGVHVRADVGGDVPLAGVLVRDNGTEIVVEQSGAASASVRYSNVLGGFAGVGNIDSDPHFVDQAGGDYSIEVGSPCIDAADNSAIPLKAGLDANGAPRFHDDIGVRDTGVGPGPIADIGAHEFQGTTPCRNDWNLDGNVDTNDFVGFLLDWNAARIGAPFLWQDPDLAFPIGVINTSDFLAFLTIWSNGCED